MSRFVFPGLLVLLLLMPMAAAAETAFPLARGVNASSWLANAMRRHYGPRDFAQIKQAGFDHVRLPVDPGALGFRLEAPDASGFDLARMDEAVATIRQAGLRVIVDMHPSSDMVDALEKTPRHAQAFIALWERIARHYQGRDSGGIAFELLNEPQYYGAEDEYGVFIQKVVAGIRRIDPARVLVVGAPQGSSIDGLGELAPLDDPNVIYDVHFYEPYMVTHQGIHMGFEDRMLRYFRQVPYPAARVREGAAFHAPAAPDEAQAEEELEDYVDENWDAARISARLKRAGKWAAKHRRRLICGEFGVLRNHIDPASRYRWIADARQGLEAQGIAWSVYDYSDIFGIVEHRGATAADPVDGALRFVDPVKGRLVIEPAALSALGLAP